MLPKAPEGDFISVELWRHRELERYFGIQSGPDPTNQSLSTFANDKGPYDRDLYAETVKELIRKSIPKETGMSVEELMALPTWKLFQTYHSVIAVLGERKEPKLDIDE